jgi:hypothetical protein
MSLVNKNKQYYITQRVQDAVLLPEIGQDDTQKSLFRLLYGRL